MQPPVPERRPHVWHRPSGAVADPYAWMRDRDDPATVAHLEAENAYAEAWFAPHRGLVDQIFDEIRSRVQETDTSVPARKGDWWYVQRTLEGAAYPVYCRGRSAASATDGVLLDVNAEAASHEYFRIGDFDVSPSHGLLAWTHDTDGSEEYVLRIRDLATGADLSDRVERTYYGTAWSADDRYVFYTVPDEAMRPHQVWRHQVGSGAAADVLVFDEADEHFFVDVDLTRSGEWIVISSHSLTSSEVHLVPAADPERPATPVRVRQPDHEYHVDHWGDVLVVLTNLEAEDFRVMTAPLDEPGRWTELVAHRPGRRITDAQAFRTHLVLHEWDEAHPRLQLLFSDGSRRRIETGDDPADVQVGTNPEYDTEWLRFEYQSLVTPRTTYEEHVRTGERRRLKQTPVPGVDLGAYRTARSWARSPDGPAVPVDVVWRDGTPQDGTAPLLLYGYGAYESSMPPWFSPARLSLLDRGWRWALAHPRGGGELGRRWYLDGKLLHKRNTFDDFLAVADHLVAEGHADADRLAIQGGSAGGLLVGACVTMRPDRFAAAVAEVPFVDVVTTMSDPTLPLTITEWEEWGDPRAEPFASYVASYSPYDNTGPASYPALYVTAGLNDPRVGYHEPAKWVARLREVNTGTRPVVFRVETGAGHGGPSGRYDAWRDTARVLAFLLVSV